MKIGLLDIETTDLEADRGFILCASFKLHGKKSLIYTTRIDDDPKYRSINKKTGLVNLFDDSVCIRAIYQWIEDERPDFLVTYNGGFFDLPYINARLAIISRKTLPVFRHIDHYRTSKFYLKLHSKSLDTLARHLQIVERKTWYDISTWRRAEFGSTPDLDLIVKHCEIDVRVLEECHDRVVPLLKTIRGIS